MDCQYCNPSFEDTIAAPGDASTTVVPVDPLACLLGVRTRLYLTFLNRRLFSYD